MDGHVLNVLRKVFLSFFFRKSNILLFSLPLLICFVSLHNHYLLTLRYVSLFYLLYRSVFIVV